MTQPTTKDIQRTSLAPIDQFGPRSPVNPTHPHSAIQAPRAVQQAIAEAAQRTSIDFDYLVAQAAVESSMDPNARARTSSASGLYQFIESTWLDTMQRHGERFGLANLAERIETGLDGTTFVSDPSQRKAILALRSDPRVASLMAAGLAEDNRASLLPILGRQPEHSELYLAHFLGAGGAGRFLSEMGENPEQNAASLFAKPAAANRAIFYEASGAPRSLSGVMQVLDAKLDQAKLSNGLDASPALSPMYPGGPFERIGQAPIAPIITPLSQPLPRSNSVRQTMSPDPFATPVGAAPPLSHILRHTFGKETRGLASDQSTAQIERAYNQLRAFGL